MKKVFSLLVGLLICANAFSQEVCWVFFTDKANEEDAANLDELINRRYQEGWELVTYNYMATSSQIKGAFIITFRKEV